MKNGTIYTDLWISRRNSLPTQTIKPKPQDPSPRALWENGLHAHFLKQRSQLIILFWKMKEVQVSQRPWYPMGLSCVVLKILLEWHFIMGSVGSFFTVCQGKREFCKKMLWSFSRIPDSNRPGYKAGGRLQCQKANNTYWWLCHFHLTSLILVNQENQMHTLTHAFHSK